MATFEKESEAFQDRNYRVHLERNWENGNKKFEAQDKRMAEMGETDYPGSNEVTQARTDIDGVQHKSLTGRLDDNELEVRNARGGKKSLAEREDGQDNDIKNASNQGTRAISIAQSALNGSPKGVFNNINDLKNEYPNGASGIYITKNNGHFWFYNNGWVDGGIYQGTEVADKSITNEKLGNEVKLNGLNSGGGSISLVWNDGYIANNSRESSEGVVEGSLINNKDFSVSQLIAVHTGDTVHINGNMGIYGEMVSLWDFNENYIRSLYDGIGAQVQVIITIPRPGYIRISNNNSKLDNSKVKVEKYPQLSFPSLPKEIVSSTEWNRVPLIWMSRAYIGSTQNPTHPAELVQNSGLDDENRVSQMFFVSKGTMLTINAATTKAGCTLAEFNENGSFVQELITGDGKKGHAQNYYFDHGAYVRAGTRLSLQTSVTIQTRKTNKTTGSSLDNKTIDVLGDSYVDNMNDPIEESWHYKIAQKHNMKYNNYGLHGNGLVSPNGNGTPVVDRFDEIDSKADYVIIMSGQNDYRKQLPLEDFRKGIDKIIKGVAGNCTGAKMAFFTMWSRGDTENQPIPQADYAQVMVDECKKFGVPCFNSFANSDNRVWDPNFRKKYMQGDNDISHLNGEGHDRFLPRAEAFLNSL